MKQHTLSGSLLTLYKSEFLRILSPFLAVLTILFTASCGKFAADPQNLNQIHDPIADDQSTGDDNDHQIESISITGAAQSVRDIESDQIIERSYIVPETQTQAFADLKARTRNFIDSKLSQSISELEIEYFDANKTKLTAKTRKESPQSVASIKVTVHFNSDISRIDPSFTNINPPRLEFTFDSLSARLNQQSFSKLLAFQTSANRSSMYRMDLKCLNDACDFGDVIITRLLHQKPQAPQPLGAVAAVFDLKYQALVAAAPIGTDIAAGELYEEIIEAQAQGYEMEKEHISMVQGPSYEQIRVPRWSSEANGNVQVQQTKIRRDFVDDSSARDAEAQVSGLIDGIDRVENVSGVLNGTAFIISGSGSTSPVTQTKPSAAESTEISGTADQTDPTPVADPVTTSPNPQPLPQKTTPNPPSPPPPAATPHVPATGHFEFMIYAEDTETAPDETPDESLAPLPTASNPSDTKSHYFADRPQTDRRRRWFENGAYFNTRNLTQSAREKLPQLSVDEYNRFVSQQLLSMQTLPEVQKRRKCLLGQSTTAPCFGGTDARGALATLKRFVFQTWTIRDSLLDIFMETETTAATGALLFLESKFSQSHGLKGYENNQWPIEMPIQNGRRLSSALGPFQLLVLTTCDIADRLHFSMSIHDDEKYFKGNQALNKCHSNRFTTDPQFDFRRYLVPSAFAAGTYVKNIISHFPDSPEFFPLGYNQGQGHALQVLMRARTKTASLTQHESLELAQATVSAVTLQSHSAQQDIARITRYPLKRDRVIRLAAARSEGRNFAYNFWALYSILNEYSSLKDASGKLLLPVPTSEAEMIPIPIDKMRPPLRAFDAKKDPVLTEFIRSHGLEDGAV